MPNDMVMTRLRKDYLCSIDLPRHTEFSNDKYIYNHTSYLYDLMKSVKYIKHRKPLFLQMIISGVLSIISISLCTCICMIFSLATEAKLNIQNLIDLLSSFLFGIIIICVPITLSSLLLIHLTGIFKYIMYSIRMIILESSLLIVTNIIIHLIIMDMNIEGFYVKSILLISIIAELYSAFVMKKLFYKRYTNFKKELEHCYVQPYIDERLDIIIAIALNIAILIPCLLFVFVLF